MGDLYTCMSVSLKNYFLRPDNFFVRFCTLNRKTQLNTNHPRVLIHTFWTTASDRKVAKNVNICCDISMKTPQTVNKEVVIRNSCLHWFNFTRRQQCRVVVPHLLYKQLTNRPSCRRSSIFSHWSDRGIVKVFFCFSAVFFLNSFSSFLHGLPRWFVLWPCPPLPPKLTLHLQHFIPNASVLRP